MALHAEDAQLWKEARGWSVRASPGWEHRWPPVLELRPQPCRFESTALLAQFVATVLGPSVCRGARIGASEQPESWDTPGPEAPLQGPLPGLR